MEFIGLGFYASEVNKSALPSSRLSRVDIAYEASSTARPQPGLARTQLELVQFVSLVSLAAQRQRWLF